MDAINSLIKICEQFKSNDLSLQEFQHKIELIILPDECKNTLEKEQRNACNKLEEIMYCYSASQRSYANEVAKALIQEAYRELGCLKIR